MLKKSMLVLVVSALGLGITACDVKKTQEGSVTVPKYEMDKTKEGNVTVPKYEVTPPDVKVSKQEKTVEVPKVEVTPAKDK